MKKTLKTVLLLMLVCIGFATNAHAQRNGAASRSAWDCCMRTAWT